MSQPYQPAPAQPQPVKSGRRFGIAALAIAGAAGLVVGGLVGGVGASAGTTSGPAATVTATATATANHTIYVTTSPTEATEGGSQPTDEATDTGYRARKADWSIGIKIKKKECFGSAGCNIVFRIAPSHVGGDKLPDSGSVDVTYKVTGCEDPYSNTFTVENRTASYDKEEKCSTTSSSKKLAAVVTDVEYSE